MIRAGQVRTLGDLKLPQGTPVLVRVDYNVPFRPGSTEIADDSRIRASLPTVRYLIGQRCRVVLCSHLGRPKGAVVESLRMVPVTGRLSQLLGVSVVQASGVVGPEVEKLVDGLAPGDVAMLENVRFHPGEEGNDPAFAAELASLAEAYVNDAFGTAHRAHASTEGVTRFLPSAAGLLMARELDFLGRTLESPERPFAAILGGAKVSDKIGVLENLLGRADRLLIGGGMAATFLKGMGMDVGASLVDEERLEFAAGFVSDAGDKLLLPDDVVVADDFSPTAACRTVGVSEIPDGWQIMDIGPDTVRRFQEALGPCRTVLWNGPMGVFEWEAFAQGTVRLARAVAELSQATSIVGGGSTAEAVGKLGLADRMSHVSTGGGASLEFLEGRVLPGVAALTDG